MSVIDKLKAMQAEQEKDRKRQDMLAKLYNDMKDMTDRQKIEYLCNDHLRLATAKDYYDWLQQFINQFGLENIRSLLKFKSGNYEQFGWSGQFFVANTDQVDLVVTLITESESFPIFIIAPEGSKVTFVEKNQPDVYILNMGEDFHSNVRITFPLFDDWERYITDPNDSAE